MQSDVRRIRDGNIKLTRLSNAAPISTTNTDVTVQIHQIESYVNILQFTQRYIGFIVNNAPALTREILACSDSPAPYTTNTDLQAVLRDARLKSPQGIDKLAFEASLVYTRFTEVIKDTINKMKVMLAAPEMLRVAALTEARDELIEARRDALGRLSGVEVLTREADEALTWQLEYIRAQLERMNTAAADLNPPLTPFLTAFIGTQPLVDTYHPTNATIAPPAAAPPPATTPAVTTAPGQTTQSTMQPVTTTRTVFNSTNPLIVFE